MRRSLLWVTLCFLGGLAAGELALYLPVTTILLLVMVSVAAVRLARRRDGPASPSALIVGATALVIGVITAHHMLAALEHPAVDVWRDRGPLPAGQAGIELTGRVHGLPEMERDRTVVLLDLESVTSPEAAAGASSVTIAGRVRLNVRHTKEGEPAIHAPAVHSGDRLRVTAELRRPYGLHNVGLFDAGRYAQRQGIDAAASVRADQLIRLGAGDGPLERALFRPIETWRAQIDKAMATSLSPPSAALLSSLILGETHRLTPDVRDAFTAAGVAHLLSISGSHLALLAGVIFLLVRGACRLLPARWLLRLTMRLSPTQLATLATVPAVVWYTLLAGGQVATIRSLLMLLLYCGAVLLSRPHDLLTALAIAALAVLVADPLALGAISFQLSYGAVLGMGLALAWWGERPADEPDEPAGAGSNAGGRPWWTPWLRRGQLYLLLTVAATAATAPLVLYHFRQFNWVGLVSNLVLPLIGVVVIPLGLLSAWLTLLFSSSMLPLASVNEWAVTVLTAVVGWFARWPGAVVHLAAPSPLTVAALYAGLAALVWGRRIRWLGGPGGLAAAVCALWAVIALAGLLRPDGQLRVSFLDVGQGDGAVINFPTGQAMVIDGGPQYGGYDTGRAVVAPYLWDHGIRRIDYLVASHPQADHIGGQIALLRLFSVGELWHNGAQKEGAVAGAWRAAATAHAEQVTTIRAADQPAWIGPVRIDLLHPSEPFVAPEPFAVNAAQLSGHGLNDSAIVMRVGLGEHRFLFTGDIERRAETELLRVEADRLPATVLKVPHHGSRTSSTPEFLEAVHPREAVISVGAYNPYHHPVPSVVEAYEARGIDLLRTDQAGQVVYLTDGTTLRRFTARELTWQPALHFRTALADEWANYRRLWLRWWWRL
jgi:competence protein ComEC